MRILTLLLTLICATPLAAEFQPLADIRSAAISVAAPDGGSAEATLDANLQMPKCAQALRAQSSGRGVTEVSCDAPTAWKLYVPVRVRRSQSIAVLVRTIGAGQTVVADAIAMQTRDAATIAGAAIYSAEQAVGRVAVRTLTAGNALLESDLVAPRAVRRGEAVTLVVRTGGIDARAPGRALGDAGLNERVNVENVSSHRVLQGFVRAGGEVEIGS